MIDRAIRHVVVMNAKTAKHAKIHVLCGLGGLCVQLTIVAWLSTGLASAQTVGASLQGIVTDSTGAALQNAEVVVIAVATGGLWELKTDTTGRYRVPVLQPGEYEVHVSQTGFQPIVRRGIVLTIGQNAVVDVKMELGRIAEAMTVTGDSPIVNTTSGAVSGLVGDKEIRELPLNGRSFQQLALLQTGVTPALAAGNDVVGGRTPKISINGARPEQSSFLLDGTDINNVYNKTPGSSAGVLLGVEAVLEFQVLTNAYSAEFGRSAGGVINAVTRSGANAVHGSGFEFHRNSALDAKNFFDPADKPIPDFYRHQFGAVVGGPVAKDRTFYFARVRVADRAVRHDRRHGRPRRRRAPRQPAGTNGTVASARPGLPRHAVPACERPLARRRRRGIPVHADAADRRVFLRRSASTIDSKTATACSHATRSTMAKWTACRRTSRRSRSRKEHSRTSTSRWSISICFRRAC